MRILAKYIEKYKIVQECKHVVYIFIVFQSCWVLSIFNDWYLDRFKEIYKKKKVNSGNDYLLVDVCGNLTKTNPLGIFLYIVHVPVFQAPYTLQ